MYEKKHEKLARFLLFLGIGLLLLAGGAFGLYQLLKLLDTPVGQIRYTEQEFVPAHGENRTGGARIRHFRKPSFHNRRVSRQVRIPDKWYLTISDEKDKTYRVEITQRQYNGDYLKNKVWPNYNAFKKEFKKLYGKNPDALSDDSEDVMLFFIIVITSSIVLSLFCFSALLNRDERGRFRF